MSVDSPSAEGPTSELVAPTVVGAGTRDHFAEAVAAKAQGLLLAAAHRVGSIGRHRVLEHVGSGGMGTVYAAYDEELDRKVAIKVLNRDDIPGEQERLRFLREAKALARLSHPNVVTIHEVGRVGDELFLAMEFVRGRTIADWMDERPGWEAVLEAFVQVGRGLVAVHEAGLVHRDLKPQNIMRRDDGVVKVLDFGLARIMDDELEESSVDEADDEASSDPRMSSLTHPGMILGTPAYMSPEQLRGDVVDARADQFSFCVVLFEALYGERPFEGSHAEARIESLERSRPFPVCSDAKVPAWLRRVVLRGLYLDPEQRWSSMEALLDELSRDPRRRRRRWGTGLVGAAVVGLGALWLGSVEQLPRPCAESAAKLEGIWDETRRTEVETAMLGPDRAYVEDAWDRTEGTLDDYARGWVAMHADACEATAIRAEQSTAVMDLRMACLHRAAVGLEVTVDLLSDADESVVRKAQELTAALPPLSRCEDIEALLAEVEPPLPTEAQAVEAVRFELARAEGALRAGRFDAARSALDEAQVLARPVRYGPLRTELSFARSKVLHEIGDYEAEHAALARTLRHATKWNQRIIASGAAAQLMIVLGHHRDRPDDAMLLWPLVDGGTSGEPRLEAHAHNILGIILGEQEQWDEASMEFRAAISLWREAGDRMRTATGLVNLSSALMDEADYEEAMPMIREATSLRLEIYGPWHPEVGVARAILARALGGLGRHEEALAELSEARSRLEASLPSGHQYLAVLRREIARAQASLGRYDEAEAEYRSLISQMTDARGPDGPEVAELHNTLGNFLRERGRYEDSEAELRVALEQRERTLGPDDADLARTRMTMAYTLSEAGRFEEALPLAELAWVFYGRPGRSVGLRGDVASLLAEILWSIEGSARDRNRARRMAENARDWYAEIGASDYQAEVERWLAQREV